MQAANVLPKRLLGLQLQSVEHISRPELDLFGQNSVVFQYRSEDGERYLVSCDFPYDHAWHELAICYQAIGWDLDQRTTGELSSAGLEHAKLELSRPNGEGAVVVFTAWGEDGAPVPAPRGGLSVRLTRPRNTPTQQQATRQHYIQAQVLCQSTAGLPEDAAEIALQLLAEAAPRFVAALGAPR